MEKKKSKKIIYIIVAIIVLFVIIDQITKITLSNKNIDIIPNVLSINYEESITGSFGVNQKGTITFLITNIIVIGIIIKFMKMQKEQIDNKTYVALSLIIAGAVGNLIDRIFKGCVIRFLKISILPIFNLSDLYIIIGWISLALFFAMFTINIKNNK